MFAGAMMYEQNSIENKPYENSLVELAKYFSTPEKIVSINEFMDFWGSMSSVEQKYYRRVSLA